MIALAFVPSLLALLACLPVPIGDPETSWIDPQLSGVWLGATVGEPGGELLVLEPYDARTWLVSVVGAETDRASPQAGAAATPPAEGLAQLEREDLEFELAVYKGWLKTIEGARFLVLEPKLQVEDDTGMKPPWWAAYRIARPAADTLELRLVSVRNELEHAKTTQEAEAVIAKHLDDPEFYDDAFSLDRVATSDYGRVNKVLKRVTKFEP